MIKTWIDESLLQHIERGSENQEYQLSEVTGVETWPVRMEGQVEQCDEADAEAHGVYLRVADGTSRNVADLPDEQSAKALVTLLQWILGAVIMERNRR